MPETPAKHGTIARQRAVIATPAEKSIRFLSQQPAFRAVPNVPSALAQPSTKFLFIPLFTVQMIIPTFMWINDYRIAMMNIYYKLFYCFVVIDKISRESNSYYSKKQSLLYSCKTLLPPEILGCLPSI